MIIKWTHLEKLTEQFEIKENRSEIEMNVKSSKNGFFFLKQDKENCKKMSQFLTKTFIIIAIK